MADTCPLRDDSQSRVMIGQGRLGRTPYQDVNGMEDYMACWQLCEMITMGLMTDLVMICMLSTTDFACLLACLHTRTHAFFLLVGIVMDRQVADSEGRQVHTMAT